MMRKANGFLQVAVLTVGALVAAVFTSPDALAQQPPTGSIDDVANRRLTVGAPGTGGILAVDDGGVQPTLFAWNLPDAPDPLTADDLFPVRGMTEVMLAAAVRSLDAGGSLDADAPIGETLPELPEALRAITLNQLLGHTAGLDDARLPEDLTMQEAIGDLPENALFTEPGAVYSYSKYSYPLAAQVLKRTFALPLGDILARAFLEPLEMVRSTFDPARAAELGLPVGYEPPRSGPPDPSAPPVKAVPVEPVATVDGLPVLYASAVDLLLFVRAWTDGTIRGIGPDALPERPIYPSVAAPRVDGFDRVRHGLHEGLAVSSRSVGFTSELRLFPSADLAVASWSNTVIGRLVGLPDEVAGFVQERLLGPDIPVTVREDATPGEAPRPLTDWVGSYFNGDELVILRPPETDVGAEIVFFDGMRELPVRRTEPDSDDLLALLPNDGRVAVRFHVFEDQAGRAYVYMREKAFRRPLEQPGGRAPLKR